MDKECAMAAVGDTISFTIYGPIVGKNAAYTRPVLRDQSRPSWKVLSTAARDFKKRIELAATVAILEYKRWPENPWRLSGVTVTPTTYNAKHDSDAKLLLLSDSLQLLLYGNDNVVGWGPNPRPIKDDGGPRIHVTVRIDALRTEEEAAILRDRFEAKKFKHTLSIRSITKTQSSKSTESSLARLEKKYGIKPGRLSELQNLAAKNRDITKRV